MIYSENPAIAALVDAHNSSDHTTKYYIDMSSYGRYAIKDAYGEVYGVFTDQSAALTAKKELECKQ